MAIDARSGAGRARISCFIPMLIFVLLVCAACAAATRAEPDAGLLYDSSRDLRSASQTFLQLISGYESADDDWTLRSLFSAPRPAPARRRDSLRVSSLPVLLLPVPVHDLQQYDPYNVRPSRRRLVPERDGDESPEPPRRGSWAPTLAADVRDPPPLDESFDEDAAPHSRSGARRDQPVVPPIESSQRLVEMFRAQEARDAEAPAVLQSEFDGSERVLLPDADDDDDDDEAPEARSARTVRALPAGAGAQAGRALPTGAGATSRARASPARPRFARPLKLRAVLTVPRAGYSEAYTAWWDPSSGDSRVHFQGGSAVTLRKMLPHGLVRKIEMHVDRAGGRVLRRCARADAVASAADRGNPALPDLQLFTFVGYEEDGAERWQHRAEGAAGEAGGARGEALTVRHELLLLRDRDDSAVPLRYSVAVDSSVLGADCDGYHHTYLETRYHTRGPEFFEVNLDEICDEVKRLNASEPEERARLEPLREFTLPRRDPRYDALLERFKERNDRRYVDDAEEAVRKNLVMQSSRFVSSGNRAGATFQLGLNFLGDRLDAELSGLGGVARDSERSRAERFPHARPALHAAERRLPDAFDWRARGGVSPVRYQGASCASCWAFATVGAVEGALFRRSGRLTPLSEQQLVDCAHPFGGNGCRGTWPSRAYDYVQERGLAALDDYVPYRGEVESCKEESVRPVTRISGHVNVTKYSVPALKVAIRQHGPAVVIVDSSPKSFTLYSKGVLYDDRCSKKSSKHAVLAVGWGQEKGEPYFILKNSWSEVWGESGYVRVQARANTCGVLTHPSYPRLEDDDVLQR